MALDATLTQRTLCGACMSDSAAVQPHKCASFGRWGRRSALLLLLLLEVLLLLLVAKPMGGGGWMERTDPEATQMHALKTLLSAAQLSTEPFTRTHARTWHPHSSPQ